MEGPAIKECQSVTDKSDSSSDPENRESLHASASTAPPFEANWTLLHGTSRAALDAITTAHGGSQRFSSAPSVLESSAWEPPHESCGVTEIVASTESSSTSASTSAPCDTANPPTTLVETWSHRYDDTVWPPLTRGAVHALVGILDQGCWSLLDSVALNDRKTCNALSRFGKPTQGRS